jgi:hypothetical protein
MMISLDKENGTIPSWARYITAEVSGDEIIALHYYRERPGDIKFVLGEGGIETKGYGVNHE